jgi:hypothetical protein
MTAPLIYDQSCWYRSNDSGPEQGLYPDDHRNGVPKCRQMYTVSDCVYVWKVVAVSDCNGRLALEIKTRECGIREITGI